MFTLSFLIVMAYCKAKEEQRWLKWKEAEEAELRRCGAEESLIQQLREYDWEMFKSDRRFLERQVPMGVYVDMFQVLGERYLPENSKQFVYSGAELLELVEDRELFGILQDADYMMVVILIYKMYGMTAGEIARHLSMTEKAIYRRLERFREKVKKVKSEEAEGKKGG